MSDVLPPEGPAWRSDVGATTEALRSGGVVAAEEEADDLVAAARDPEHLAAMVARRLRGEPTAWLTGTMRFLGLDIVVRSGVYVTRWQTEQLARHASTHLGDDGIALDVCTGAGTIGAYLRATRGSSRVLGTDIDTVATECARVNGVEAYSGDLYDPVPADLRGQIDLVVAVPPYVPERMLRLLPRDVVVYEPHRALVGGDGGLDVARRIVAGSVEWLAPGGFLALEVGVDQVDAVATGMVAAGLSPCSTIYDDDGDPRGACGQLRRRPG